MTQLKKWGLLLLQMFGMSVGVAAVGWFGLQFLSVVLHARDHDTPKVVAVQEPVPIPVQTALIEQELNRITMMLRQIQAAQVQQMETTRKARTP